MFWVARGLLLLPATGLVALSFAANGYFWAATMAHDPRSQAAWVAISVMCGLLKVGVPIAFAVLALGWRDQKAVAAAFAVALIFDIFSGLGFSALTRGDAVASRQHDAAPTVELARQRGEASAALARLASVRLTARVAVERDAAARRAPDCKRRANAKTEACQTLARLDAELADARERDRLAAAVDDLSGRLTAAEPVRDADPQIAAIALALSSIGLAPDRETLSKLFGLLLVLLIELGSTALPRAAFAQRAPASIDLSQEPAPPAAAEPASPKPRRATRSKIDTLDVLRAACAGRMSIPGATLTADGWLYVSQRALADVAGQSPPTVGRKLKDAERSGTISVRTDGRGSAIRLNLAQPAVA